MDKRQVRQMLRSRAPDPAERACQSASVCRHILGSDVYRRAGVVCGYIPLRHEADITPVLADVLRSGRTLLLPRCGEPPRMTLHAIPALDALRPGKFGIPEPGAEQPCVPPDEADLILVPLEGIDHRGFRLGKGGGYYDRLLTRTGGFALGCALKSQWVDVLPADAWDQPLHACADADGIRHFDRPCVLCGKENRHECEKAKDREGHQALSEGLGL